MADERSNGKAVWVCRVGEIEREKLPKEADQAMRNAVADAYWTLTARNPTAIFSGWGYQFDEPERAVIENREPRRPNPIDLLAAVRGLVEDFFELEPVTGLLRIRPREEIASRILAWHQGRVEELEGQRDAARALFSTMSQGATALEAERDHLRADLDAARGDHNKALAAVAEFAAQRERNQQAAIDTALATARRLRAALEDCLYEHALPEGRECQCERCQGIREAQASA